MESNWTRLSRLSTLKLFFIISFLLFILLPFLSVADYSRDSVYYSCNNKKFTLKTSIDPLSYIPHNHDGTFEGEIVFFNYEFPLWPLLLRDYLDRTINSEDNTYIHLRYFDQMIWTEQPNQLGYQNDTLFLNYHHRLLVDHDYTWRRMRNEIFTLLDYALRHKQEIRKAQRKQIESKYDYGLRTSITEDKMFEILEDKIAKKHIIDFFKNTAIYPHRNYQGNRDHNIETDSLLGSYFQNDSIHLFNRKSKKVFFKSPEISSLLKVGHYNYVFQPIFTLDPVNNYNAKMDKLFILMEPVRRYKGIYGYHDTIITIFGIWGGNRGYTQETGISLIDQYAYNPCRIDYIFRNENEAPTYFKNPYYEEFLELYPPTPKSNSYIFAYLAIAFLLGFTLWYLKINMPHQKH
jgi:hypothetical protein